VLAKDLYDNFHKHAYAGFNILGYIEDDNYGGENHLKGKLKLGTYSGLSDILADKSIESVLVTIPSSEHDKLYDLMRSCEGENVEFLMVPDFLETITSTMRVQEIDGVPFLRIKGMPMNLWNRIMKRIFDFTFALVLLVTSPYLQFTAC
jgi:FlaA1/EpsC-like NDP-sugar epimerase